MRVIDTSRPIEGAAEYGFVSVRPTGNCDITTQTNAASYALSFSENQLPTENALRVYVNGEPTMTLMCSPDHIVELVCGRLLTEDIVSSLDEIDEIFLCEYSTRVMVFLHDRAVDIAQRHVDVVSTCCTFNRTLNSLFSKGNELQKVIAQPWRPAWIFEMAKVFEADAPMHKQTCGAHSCYLAHGEQILYCCEDLGRHNAFDKVVGCALMDGIDLSHCTVFTSGRIPTDMVVKAIRAGIPTLVSKAVPTDMTVEMAREYGLTLICSAHSDSLKVFNDPLGIATGKGIPQAC